MSASNPVYYPTHEFQVNFQRFNPSVYQIPSTSPEKWSSPLEKKEFARFVYNEAADTWLEDYRVSGRKWEKFYDTLAKAIAVFAAFTSAMIPLTIGFAPVWVPWGICLPSIIILAIIQGKLQGKVEHYQRSNVFAPLLKEFLKHDTTQPLHPIGEWDLPKSDQRLKSDVMMENELKKKHPKSGKEVKRVIETYDLEVTPYAQQYCACDFAEIDLETNNWRAIQEAARDKKKYLARRDGIAYQKTNLQAFEVAYQGQMTEDYPFTPTNREKVETIVRMYAGFCRLFPKLEQRLLLAEGLYSEFVFLSEGEQKYPDWVVFRRQACEIKKAIDPLIELLATDDTENLNSISDEKLSFLRFSLADLIGQSSVIRKNLKGWKKNHPYIRLKRFEEELIDTEKNNPLLKDLGTARPLSRASRQQLSAWIKHNPDAAQKKCCLRAREEDAFPAEIIAWMGDSPSLPYITPLALQQKMKSSWEELCIWIKDHPELAGKRCIEVMHLESFPKEIADWIGDSSSLRFVTTKDLKERYTRIRKTLVHTKKAMANLKRDIQGIEASAGHYEAYLKKLEDFENKEFKLLKQCVYKQGEASRLKLIFEMLLTKLPVAPFIHRLPGDPVLKPRAVQQIKLDRLLKQIDKKMLVTNRVRVGLIRIPVFLLIIAEAIFALYFSTPWFYWGCCMAVLIGEGISYYVDMRLRAMDHKKQTLKLWHIIMDHPDIKAIPGTRPRLGEIKGVQYRYFLDGVEATQARVIAEGDGILPNLFSGVEPFGTLAREGSGQTEHYLENRLIVLKSELELGHHTEDEKIELQRRIDEIEYGRSLSRFKREQSDYTNEEREKRLKELRIQRSRLKSSLYPKLPRDPTRPYPVRPVSDYEKWVNEGNQLEREVDHLYEDLRKTYFRFLDLKRGSKQFVYLEREIKRIYNDAQLSTESKKRYLTCLGRQLEILMNDPVYGGSKASVEAQLEPARKKMEEMQGNVLAKQEAYRRHIKRLPRNVNQG